MKVKKNTLLLLACLVWTGAGFQVLRTGLHEYTPYLSFLNLILSLAVFSIFQAFVFGPLVKKHTKRIHEYNEPFQFFFKFFDRKSFLIMAFMMTGGILLRRFSLVPASFIAVFYSGLGASLMLAGILFGRNYLKFFHLTKEENS